MNVRIAFRGMDHSNAMETYAREAMQKINTFLKSEHEPISLDCVLEAARQHHHHKVEIRLTSKHYHTVVVQEGPELYLLIDTAVKITVEDIKKQKDKALSKRNHPEHTIKDNEEE